MTLDLLDLFSGAGGCSVGYHRAGFHVRGIDHIWHLDYPYVQYTADAVAVAQNLEFFADHRVIHASPPCPRWSTITPAAARERHPDLLSPVRTALRSWSEQTGGVYVIENVPQSPLEDPVILCGSMFGLPIHRHRHFEVSANIRDKIVAPRCQHHWQTEVWGVYGKPDTSVRLRPDGTRRGNKVTSTAQAQDVLGIDWMRDWYDLKDSVPPAYTHWLGQEIIGALL